MGALGVNADRPCARVCLRVLLLSCGYASVWIESYGLVASFLLTMITLGPGLNGCARCVVRTLAGCPSHGTAFLGLWLPTVPKSTRTA